MRRKTWDRERSGARAITGKVALLAASLALFASPCLAHTTASRPVATEAEEDPSLRLRGDALRAEIPDLEVRGAPPRLWFTALLTPVNFPFQLLSAGAEVGVYPVPWLHARASYLVGLSFAPNGLTASQYADAFVGLRVLGVDDERAVDIALQSSVHEFKQNAWIPSSHGLYVEGGVLAGFMSLNRCATNCEDLETRTFAPAPRQYVLPAFGLRYLQFSSYRSQKRNIRQEFAPEVFAQVVLPAVNAPEYTLHSFAHRPLTAPAIGFRAGAHIPVGLFGPCLASLVGFRCLQGRFSVGYAPLPIPIFFEFSLEFPFYAH